MIKTVCNSNHPTLFTKPIKECINFPVVVSLSGEVCDSSVKEVGKGFEEAHATGQPIIPFVIDSYGGSVYSCLAILDIMTSSSLPVATIGISKCMSAAGVILACGTRGHRYLQQNATVMIHDVSSFVWGKLSDLKNDVRETERLSEILFSTMSKACGHRDIKYFQKLIHKYKNTDIFMDSEESVKHKIIDHVGTPTFSIDFNISYKLI